MCNVLMTLTGQSELEARQTGGVKRGKTCNSCQARENMQPVPSAGKLATGVKQPVPRTGKLATRENKQPQDAFGVIG